MFRICALLPLLFAANNIHAASVCDVQYHTRDVNIDGLMDSIVSSPCENDNRGKVVILISTGTGTAADYFDVVGSNVDTYLGSTIQFKQDKASEPPLIIIGTDTRCKVYTKYDGIDKMVTYWPPCAR